MKIIYDFYNNNKKTIIVLLIYSFLVYSYAGFNTIINLDGVDDFIINNRIVSYKLYISLGRWFWGLIEYIFLEYPSPVISLMLNCVLFSASGVLLGKILDIRNNTYVILLSMIMIAFPTNIASYTYLSWQQVIGIGYFMSLFSVYKIKSINNYKDIFLPALFISFAIGIYQAFLPLIIVLALVTIIIGLKDKSNRETLKYSMKFIICGIVGCTFYYLIVKMSTLIFNVDMISYQGASSMFNINFTIIKFCFINTLKKCFNIFLGNLFPNYLLIVFSFLSIIGVILYFFKIKKDKYLLGTILFGLILLSPRIIEFVNPLANYHLLTNSSYSMYFCGLFSLIVFFVEQIKNKKYKSICNKILIFVFSTISFLLLVLGNKSFIMSKQMTDASFHYLNRMQTRIEMLDGYAKLPNPKKYYFYFTKENVFPYSKYAYANEIGVTSSFLGNSIDIGSALNILGENVIIADLEIEEEVELKEIVSNKKSYPDNSSIFIYKDIVVIVI